MTLALKGYTPDFRNAEIIFSGLRAFKYGFAVS